MSKAKHALSLQASLEAEAESLAKAEGTTLNQLINVAVAEKVSALRTSAYFKERAARADVAEALELLERAGDEEPWTGDAIPDGPGPMSRAGR
ncbi:MAG TPA: hypothetical protein VFZ01_20480 [Geminicoccaceae bacterium]